jgi:hypothetical protein
MAGGWLLAAAVFVLGCAFLVASGGVTASASDGPVVVEVERWLPAANGGTKRVILLVDTRLADPEQVIAEAYPNAVEPPPVSAQFVTFAKWAPQDIPVPVGYDATNDPTGISGGPVLAAAASTWNAVPGNSFEFATGGPVGSDTPICDENEGDGVNTVVFSADLAFGVLGEMCPFGFGSVGGVPRITEFDIQFSSTLPWSTASVTPGNKFDLQTVMLHELGHAMGLDHSSDGTVMQPFLGPGTQLRTPTADDIAAVQSLYGSVTQTPSATSTPTFTPSLTPTATPSPTPTQPPVSLGQRAFFGSVSRD